MYVNEIPLEAHDIVEYTRNHPQEAVGKIRVLQIELAAKQRELENGAKICIEQANEIVDRDKEIERLKDILAAVESVYPGRFKIKQALKDKDESDS